MRRVIDDVVMLNPKYDGVKETDEYAALRLVTGLEMTKDKKVSISLKRTTQLANFTIIDPVVVEYNRIQIKGDNCALEIEGRRFEMNTNRIRFVKALLRNTVNANKKFAQCCGAYAQHILQEVMQGKEPGMIISSTAGGVEDLIYRELGEFYISECA